MLVGSGVPILTPPTIPREYLIDCDPFIYINWALSK